MKINTSLIQLQTQLQNATLTMAHFSLKSAAFDFSAVLSYFSRIFCCITVYQLLLLFLGSAESLRALANIQTDLN